MVAVMNSGVRSGDTWTMCMRMRIGWWWMWKNIRMEMGSKIKQQVNRGRNYRILRRDPITRKFRRMSKWLRWKINGQHIGEYTKEYMQSLTSWRITVVVQKQRPFVAGLLYSTKETSSSKQVHASHTALLIVIRQAKSPDVLIGQAVLKRFVYRFKDVQASDALFTLHFDWPTFEFFTI